MPSPHLSYYSIAAAISPRVSFAEGSTELEIIVFVKKESNVRIYVSNTATLASNAATLAEDPFEEVAFFVAFFASAISLSPSYVY
jgi:hypothetical protein